MVTETAELTLINGLAIDSTTGEIVDAPAGIDVIEAVMESLVLVERNLAGWEQRKAILKQTLTRHMRREGLRKLETKWGRAIEVDPGVSEFGKPEEIPSVVKDFELDMATELALYATAKTLDPKKLRAVTFDEEILRRLIGQKPRAGYLRVDPPVEEL